MRLLLSLGREEHVTPHIIERLPVDEKYKQSMFRERGLKRPKPPEPSTELSWLTFDFSRQPLPSLVELENACHFVWIRAGWKEYLCKRPSSPDCRENEAFSSYYGEPIYVCRQPA